MSVDNRMICFKYQLYIMDSRVMQWLALFPHSKKILVLTCWLTGVLLHGFLVLWAFYHSPKSICTHPPQIV